MQEEVECPGPSFRVQLWVGTPGTSSDLSWSQTEALLLDQEFVLPPLPNLERFLKLCNMKEWQCGVFQLCDYRGEPFKNPLPYALLFNDLHHVVSDWMCTGETNKDGIFHTHAMFRTGVRSDSLRRTLHTVWNKLLGSSSFRDMLGGRSASMDCLKLQKCHKPESMMAYLMKDPLWVIGTKRDYLEALWAIDGWQLNERFKPKEESEQVVTDKGEMNKMTQEIIDLITEYGCKTFDDCLRFGPLIMQKYLHRPGLNTIVENCLRFVKSTGSAWSIAVFERHRPDPSHIHRILLFQGVPPTDFDKAFFAWITKSHPKRNTICIQGPSNTGKSKFIAGFKQCVPWGEIVNAPTFAFEALPENQFGVWEEPLCSPELAEKAKQVLEGMPTSIPIKHKKPMMLPRTPILITTNHDLWRFCKPEEEMFKNRMWIFYFNHIPENALMFPRTSEHSCKCCCCRTGGGGTPAHGESSPGRLQSGKQPLDESVRTSDDSSMGSRPMLRTGAGTSERNSGTSSSTISCSDSSSAHTSGSSGKPGNTAEQHMGQFRIIRGDNPKHKLPGIREYVESHKRRRCSGTDSSATGSRSDGGGDVGHSLGGARRFEEKYGSSGDVVLQSSNKSQKGKNPRYPKGQSLDSYLESIDEPFVSQMYSPDKTDWQHYLSYLFYRYG